MTRFVALTTANHKGRTDRSYVDPDSVVFVGPSEAYLKVIDDRPTGKVARTKAGNGAAEVHLSNGTILIVVHDDAPYTDATPIEVVETVIAKLQGEGT